MTTSPSQQATSVVSLVIKSNGAALDDSVRVVSVSVHKRLNEIPKAMIVFADGDMPSRDFPLSNSESLAPGIRIEIVAGYDQVEERIFEGLVVRHAITISGENASRLEVECLDRAVQMTVGERTDRYSGVTHAELITRLIERHEGLVAKVEPTASTRSDFLQDGRTDWDFMLSLAEANGRNVIVEAGEITVCEPDVSMVPELRVAYGDDIMEFRGSIDAQPDGPAIRRGEVQSQGSATAVVGRTLRVEGVGDRLSGDVVISALVHELFSGAWTTKVNFV